MDSTEASTTDLFAATRFLDSLWNSRARAVGPNAIEWECRTWGSGRGGGQWVETVLFQVVSERFDLDTWRNSAERDELVVLIPLDEFDDISRVIGRLDEDLPERWPWRDEDLNRQDQIVAAAEVLELTPDELQSDTALLDLLRLR